MESLTSKQAADNAKRWEEHEVRQARDRRTALWKASGVPARHARMVTSGKLESSPGPWLEARAKIVDRLGTGFLIALIGPRGTGKTQLASDAMHRATLLDLSAAYFKAMDLFVKIRGTYDGRSGGERGALNEFLDPHLLVIDEVQNRKNGEWEDTVLTNLIDRRYDQGTRDTLLIANLKRKEFEEDMGSSIVSRIGETGGIVVCDWPSFRSKA